MTSRRSILAVLAGLPIIGLPAVVPAKPAASPHERIDTAIQEMGRNVPRLARLDHKLR